MVSKHRRLWYLLLLAPMIGPLLVPLYNRVDPMIWGIPFFYSYLLGWVLVSGLITGLVYLKTEADHAA